MPEPAVGKNMEVDEEQGLPNGCYRLNNPTDETFTNRVDSIFGCLESLEQKHCEAVKGFETINDDDEEEEPCSSSGSNSHSTNKNNEKSISDQKCNIRKRHPPDFVANPSKWKKYSLREDGTSGFTDLSADQLNSKVATDLMDSLKKQKENETDTQVGNAFVFKIPDLPSTNTTTTAKTETKSLFGTSHGAKARCMETYEFGQNVKTKKDITSKNISSSNIPVQQVKLDYEHPDEIGSDDKTEYNDGGGSGGDDGGEIKDDERDSQSKVFISRGKKKNRVIRKRVSDEE